jgi:hypothetical protein
MVGLRALELRLKNRRFRRREMSGPNTIGASNPGCGSQFGEQWWIFFDIS